MFEFIGDKKRMLEIVDECGDIEKMNEGMLEALKQTIKDDFNILAYRGMTEEEQTKIKDFYNKLEIEINFKL